MTRLSLEADIPRAAVEAAVALAQGTLKRGDTAFRNAAGATYEVRGDQLLLGQPFIFNRDNIDQFNF